ncbi:MAG: membrane protein insertase YidC [Zymomonas mobilis]|uniref:Membrane protein insertase YidC n=1 Tax=Zymomonas mobilis TaxID=542 RepID=A0A542W2X5_ZYMMB|nr:membrane protein insertase YidC [Zymomonas mobilis]TQL17930.1 protein translocase subunit yidC [Zymomonas mobilis]
MDDQHQQRNLVIVTILSAAILFGWSFVTKYWLPTNPAPTHQANNQPKAELKAEESGDKPLRPVNQVLQETPRLPILTESVEGSVNLKGLRLDDLTLIRHRETLAKNSPAVRLFSPAGTQDSWFTSFGWTGENVVLPGADSLWKADSDKLTAEHPVNFYWNNDHGQIFRITLSVDHDYMFNATESVINRGNSPVVVQPYVLTNHQGAFKTASSWTLHTGPIGVFNGSVNYHVDFADIDKATDNSIRNNTQGGWIGFSDKYWLTALAPHNQKIAIDTDFRSSANHHYQADFTVAPVVVGAGKTASTSVDVFAGAKEVRILDRYRDQLHLPHFDKAIDWGWFAIIEKVFFYYLDWLFLHVGNYGLAIILMVFTIRALIFPIANKQYASMASMRRLQPKMQAVRERYKNDEAKMRQELVTLYQKEKVNPFAGCLPMFIQFPIFIALYKTLLVTIESRHQPFILWIKDLSAPDPLTPFNLFGLLSFTPPHFLMIGVLPILLGITMWLQFRASPQQLEPAQQQIMSFLPLISVIFMAPLAAGLQVYYIFNNLISLAQMTWLQHRHSTPEERQDRAEKKRLSKKKA